MSEEGQRRRGASPRYFDDGTRAPPTSWDWSCAAAVCAVPLEGGTHGALPMLARGIRLMAGLERAVVGLCWERCRASVARSLGGRNETQGGASMAARQKGSSRQALPASG